MDLLDIFNTLSLHRENKIAYPVDLRNIALIHLGNQMAKPNYAFAKRQKELAKQAKAEEKRKKKAEQAAEANPTEGGEAITPTIDPDKAA